ncbi:MAG TPA: protein translocase subunit SecF [Kofleriaceae bacterium]|nr:protein translocase subunit SecF [Kofleriaceae bacterium]
MPVDTEHRFRYLLPPGNNFAFVAKFKIWIVISCLLMATSIGALFVNNAVRGSYMNWTIDFKGGTEIIYAFQDKTSHAYVNVDTGKVREGLAAAGEHDLEVSNFSWADDDGKTVQGMIVRTPRFTALPDEAEKQATADFSAKFADRKINKLSWSGDRLYVRSEKPITNQEAAPVFSAVTYEKVDAKTGAKTKVSGALELKPWLPGENDQYLHADESTGEYNEVFSMWGLDRQYQQALDKAMPNVEAIPRQSYGVGAKAGDKLRNDAAKSIIYALFLIMLYLAFRFDIRYAPGAAFATVHDAMMVIGVFAVTWTEVSLTSVAGLLTVMGYSTNDTVIVFDRIRENQAKLKDKKIDRIVDLSLNEMLTRTILTSSTVFATTLIMNIFGTGDVRNFAFAMNIGVIVGTYSSIFLASPIFMWISKKWYSAPSKRRIVPTRPDPQMAE